MNILFGIAGLAIVSYTLLGTPSSLFLHGMAVLMGLTMILGAF